MSFDSYTSLLPVLLIEELDPEATWLQWEPGRASPQEEACQSAQRPESGELQEQSPPPVVRPGEQSPPGAQTRQEEEETPEQEALSGEFEIFCQFTAKV